jgi:transcriptional regulator with XRE-family HTH domain
MTVREAFARRLRTLREQRRLSQAALAERVTGLGVPMERAAVTRIEWAGDPERSRARNVSLEEAVAFAVALGVPFASLLLGHEEEEIELTPQVRVRTPFVNGWLAGRMPLDPADAEFYAEAVDELNETGGPDLTLLLLTRDLNDRERKMAEAAIQTMLEEADDFERVAAKLDNPRQAEELRNSADRTRRLAAHLREQLEEKK